MAGNKETLNIPNEVIDAKWEDDIDVDYAIYGNNESQEGEYISPDAVSKETANQIKNFQVKLAWNGLKKFRQQASHELALAA